MAQRKRGRVALKGVGEKDPLTGRYPKYFWYVFINEDRTPEGKYPVKAINTWLPERGNKKNAERIMQQKVAEYEEELSRRKSTAGNNVEARVEPKNYTFIEYLYKYVEHKKPDVTPLVYKTYKATVTQLADYFKIKKMNPLLTEVKAGMINDYYDYLRQRVPRQGKKVGIKITTLKHISNVIRPALRQAYEIDELLPNNPYDKVKKLKKDIREEPERPYLSEDEIIDFCNRIENHELGDLYKLCIYLGLRRSELLGLRYSNIDFEKGTIAIIGSVLKIDREFVFNDYNKTEGSTDVLILPDEALKVLLDRKQKVSENMKLFGNAYNPEFTDFVCVNAIGDLYNPDYISNSLRKIAKSYNLKNIHLHSLRHSYCSLLYEKTKDIELVMKMMRHSNIKTTMLYLHRDEIDVKRQGADALNSIGQHSEP